MPFKRNKHGYIRNTLEKLPHHRFIAALLRIRQQILDGSVLDADDCTDIGNKYTHCNWGLCSMSLEQWPDKEDRSWPDESPLIILSREKGDQCPFDKNDNKHMKNMPEGCFHRCRIFQDGLKSREEAIKLYDITIARHQ